jgi:hypothetical protein
MNKIMSMDYQKLQSFWFKATSASMILRTQAVKELRKTVSFGSLLLNSFQKGVRT